MPTAPMEARSIFHVEWQVWGWSEILPLPMSRHGKVGLGSGLPTLSDERERIIKAGHGTEEASGSLAALCGRP